MTMTDSISNSEDIIDSRDVIARIEDLEADEEKTAEEVDELEALTDLAKDAEDYAIDWECGEILIRGSHFTAYAQELASDCGMVNDSATWPNNCIDWEYAAEQLKQDYIEVDFDGVSYFIR